VYLGGGEESFEESKKNLGGAKKCAWILEQVGVLWNTGAQAFRRGDHGVESFTTEKRDNVVYKVKYTCS